MVDLTDRQRRELAALDYPTPCTVVIGGAIGRDCEQAAVWQVECKGCHHRFLTCEEHHALMVGAAAPVRCLDCGSYGPLSNVFVFERLRVQS